MYSAQVVKQSGIGAGDDHSNVRLVPNADVISLETMVHMLVNKKICTAEELFVLQGRVQELTQNNDTNNFVPIHNNFDRGKFPALKRALSQHRWSRRLGTLLFGWKWKKIKKNVSS